MNADIPSSFSGPIIPAAGSQNVIGKIPPGIVKLAEGTLVNAIVLRHDAAGNAVLGLQGGELTVKSLIPLPNGSALVLKIIGNQLIKASETSAPKEPTQTKPLAEFDLRAQIVLINGKPPQPPASAEGQQADHSGYNIVKAILPQTSSHSSAQAGAQQSIVTSAESSSNASIIKLSGGTITDAIVITPSPMGTEKFLPKGEGTLQQPYNQANVVQATQPLKASDNLSLHIISVNLPNSNGSDQPAAKPVAHQVQTAETLKTPASPSQSPGQNIIPEQTANNSPKVNLSPGFAAYSAASEKTSVPQQNQEIKVQQTPSTDKVRTEGTAQQATKVLTKISPITNNPIFSATVIGTEKSGEAVLKTPLGIIKLSTGISLPQGTTLEIEVLRVQPAEARAVTQLTDQVAQIEAAKLRLFGANSPFAELASVLAGFDAELGTSVLEKTMPFVEKQFAAKLLWFLSGISSGDVNKWLSPEARNMLEQYNKHELINNLDKAFATLRTMHAEPTNSGWSSFLFPVYDGSKLQYAQVYVRRDGKKQNANKDNKEDVRFLVEIYLDRVGEMQMDGMVKNLPSSKTLDLYIRTKDDLPEEMRSDIINIFVTSTEISGIKGDLQFQVVSEFSNRPMEESEDEAHDGGILA